MKKGDSTMRDFKCRRKAGKEVIYVEEELKML